MPLIPFDSPLRNLPRELNERQKVSYDGIRLAIQMIDVASQRLYQDLGRISEKTVQLGSEEASLLFASCTADAWSIVDNAGRLHLLLTTTPNLKLTAELKEHLGALKGVDPFRNGFQNLKKLLGEAEKQQHPILGTISWVWSAEASSEPVRVFTMVPGSLRARSNRALNPAGLPLTRPLDSVTLDAFGKKLNLSDLVRTAGALAGELDLSLKNSYGTESGGGADLLFSMEISLDQSPVD